nr:Chain B, Chains: B,D,F [Homo sapiens]6TNO_D Chain D, Chains: B,D,F [Homo sapiens]6TNO_F Chain F, Chains: B,D,F [Homo sapiens]
RIPSYRYR